MEPNTEETGADVSAPDAITTGTKPLNEVNHDPYWQLEQMRNVRDRLEDELRNVTNAKNNKILLQADQLRMLQRAILRRNHHIKALRQREAEYKNIVELAQKFIETADVLSSDALFDGQNLQDAITALEPLVRAPKETPNV
jgi:vacuolar-type H+-ATPase subunit I/STV1